MNYKYINTLYHFFKFYNKYNLVFIIKLKKNDIYLFLTLSLLVLII